MISASHDSTRERFAKALIVGAVCAALGAMVLSPSRARSVQAETALAAAESYAMLAPEAQGDLAALRLRLERYERSLDCLPQAPREGGSQSMLHGRVEKIAEQVNVSIRAFDVSAPTPIPSSARGDFSDISETRVSLRAEGTYAAITAFLDAYAHGHGAVAFRDTRMLASDVPGEDVINLSLEVSHFGLIEQPKIGEAP
ncbi:MAG: hypothetical protein AAGD00_05725 [Planctomycetota bacterium]